MTDKKVNYEKQVKSLRMKMRANTYIVAMLISIVAVLCSVIVWLIWA